jgi:hypothetical protein
METLKIDIDDKTKVRITSIGGDLRLTGREGAQLEAHAPVGGALSVTKDNGSVTIACRSGCLVFLPARSHVQADTVGGDLRAIGLSSDFVLGTVGGDCSLRRMGKVTIDRIGGDLDARKLDGDLKLESGGSDGIVSRVQGSVDIGMLGGDFTLSRVQGNIEVSIGGDASLRLSPQAKDKVRVSAGGDLVCHLPDETSAAITVKAGGDLRLSGIGQTEDNGAGRVLRMGNGESEINLSAGGDLLLSTGAENFAEVDLDLGESIAARIEGKMADLEARFSAHGSGFSQFDSDRIGERVRRVVSRSMRQAAKAQRRAQRNIDQAHRTARVHVGPLDLPAREAASEEERMSILRMLEEGKINVDQAEKLLKALEEM